MQRFHLQKQKSQYLHRYVYFFFFLSGKLIRYSLIRRHLFQLTAVCCSRLYVSQSIRVQSTLYLVSISAARISTSVALGFSAVFLCSWNLVSQMFRSYHLLDYALKGNKTNIYNHSRAFNVTYRVFSRQSPGGLYSLYL